MDDENLTLAVERPNELKTKEAEQNMEVEPNAECAKETIETKIKSRKNPKKSRTEKQKVKPEESVSKVDKKTYKESLNTALTRPG